MQNVDNKTSLIDPRSLIDCAAIRAADAARDAALTAHREAQVAVKAAEVALQDANDRADRAASNDGDVVAAETAVQRAEVNLRVAKRRLAAAAAAAAEAPATHRAAVGVAHAAAVRAAVRATLDCHLVAAEAKKTITAAERRVAELQVLLNGFQSLGAVGLREGANRAGILREPADDIRFWAAHGFTFEDDKQ